VTEYCPGDPFLVALTARHLGAVAVDEPSPEDLVAAKEEAGFGLRRDDGEDDGGAERAEARLATLIEQALPVEEAYMLRRALDGASQRTIAAAVGIRQPSVHLRLTRAVESLRRAATGRTPLRRAASQVRIPGLVAVTKTTSERQETMTTTQVQAQHINGTTTHDDKREGAFAELLAERDALQAKLVAKARAQIEVNVLARAALDAEDAECWAVLAQCGADTKAKAKRGPRGAGERGRRQTAPSGDVLSVIRSAGSDGMSAPAIGKATGLNAATVKARIQKLPTVEKIGKGRATAYRVVGV
jgi:hypothetical protein